MIKRGWIILCVILAFASPAGAEPLTADMSTYRIDMDANFSGTRVFLFGARNEPGDIVAVIRGPAKNYIMRKKENIAGMWLNSSRMKFFSVPAFYHLAASKPLSEIADTQLLEQLGIGELHIMPKSSHPNYPQFADAFMDHQRDQKRFMQNPLALQLVGETLFKSVFEFSDNIPPGDYTTEIYLIHDGRLIDRQVLPLAVVKTGLDAWLYNFAHDRPGLYGLTAIFIALAAGWFAGRIFENLERAS
jgi:uncharacterized protein (TIGR02186 family)